MMKRVSSEAFDRLLHSEDEALGAESTEEAAQMQSALLDLRRAAVPYAEAEWARAAPAAIRARRPGGLRPRIALLTAAATLLIVGASSAVHQRSLLHSTAHAAAPIYPVASSSDEALLRSIDRDLSTFVPVALTPLATTQMRTNAGKPGMSKRSRTR